MTIPGVRLLLTALIATALIVPCQARAQSVIPTSAATTLTGTEVHLPDALKGRPGVLVLGFSHASQTQVEGWGHRLAADRSGHIPAFFEMPMLAGAPKILRGMIVKKMATSVPEVEKPHFMPVMENEAGWRAVARYAKPDDAYVLLVDGNGKVLWQSEGEATDAAWHELIKNLQATTHSVTHD